MSFRFFYEFYKVTWKTRSLTVLLYKGFNFTNLCAPRHTAQKDLLKRTCARTYISASHWFLRSLTIPKSFDRNPAFCKNYSTMSDQKFIVGYAKLGTSNCKKCKVKIDKGSLRVGKVVPNPFSDEGGDMKNWYHPSCIFETFKRARATTKKIEDSEDLEGFADLENEDKDLIKKLIEEWLASSESQKKKAVVKQTKLPFSPKKAEESDLDVKAGTSKAQSGSPAKLSTGTERDNSFREFRRLCADIAEENSHTGKTQIVQNYITKGPTGHGFSGDVYLVIKLLLPGVVKTVYNLNNKQLVKLFSQIFGAGQEDMTEDLNQGDVAETIKIFFDESLLVKPQKKSTLSIQEVDEMLQELSMHTKEDAQQRVLAKVTSKCTSNDLKMFVRLIKHDLRINAGAKNILDGLDANAYAAFQASRDLRDVVDRVLENKSNKQGLSKKLSVRASLMTPVLPMLAEACRSIDQAMKKCPNGFYAEIKYDGERLQVHKNGKNFQYFSRSLKPVLPHKVAHFKEYIPKAFPTGDDLILDGEVLLIDTKTGKPLPFGTLGVHKKAKFENANVCLFIFDCLHLNGENLMNKPIQERRKVLQENMKEIKNRVMFSEMEHIKKQEQLEDMMTRVFKEGLEGLVLKDVNGIYEPGKRHWLKVKKDYLNEGSMADSADLIVLGAYYGTGNKGGIMSVFLCGVYDPDIRQFCTVTKVGNGLDDKTLEDLQTSLDVVKISKNMSKVPPWLDVKKSVVPDFVVKDPKKAPVWEIVGAEFSKAEVHSADGISIRFPRVTKFRDDKTWKEATDLPRLQELFKKSKETADFTLKGKGKSPKQRGSKMSSCSDSDEDYNNSAGARDTPVKDMLANKEDDEEDVSATEDEKAVEDRTPSKANSNGKNTSADSTPVKKGVKRSGSALDDDDISPGKKAKPACKYGADCYQTNPTHLKSYSHPPKSSCSSPNSKSQTDKSLMNIFSGAKIYLPSDMADFKTLKRFILAFDGDLVADFDKASATHAIVSNDSEKVECSGVCVKVDWLWKCIKTKQLVKTVDYALN
ncbi:hypothetical protein CHS0354_016266 [Potamilus streckersoni]|uniref:DNA ligase 3 n=1 Tax=Potamilus streckersoni TaxID=2493646 RepID=A0AAE0RXA1_9BIVA|nr:hypothetical protein CHS0354_016266 [Potamilus streckersoni]